MPQGTYKRKTPEERFWKQVNKSKKCWEWLGTKDKKGYGRIGINGKTVLSHRFSYLIFNGKIPQGMCVCHFCDNPPCVNPKHLWIGSRKDNLNDMIDKGRDKFTNIHRVVRGEENGLSKFTEAQILKIKILYNDGIQQWKIAEKFKCHQTTIHYIVTNKTWKHVKAK